MVLGNVILNLFLFKTIMLNLILVYKGIFVKIVKKLFLLLLVLLKIVLISLTTIKEKNLTALMITHNLQDALTYGNRILLLHQGEIVRDFSEEEKKKLSVTDLYKIMVELDEKDN